MNIGGKTTNPGDLDIQVTLQSRTVTVQTGNFQKPSWANIATVWAKWRNVHGSEAWMSSTIEAEGAATVTIRYRTGIDTTCAVLKGSTRYEILSIDNIEERSEYLELRVRRLAEG